MRSLTAGRVALIAPALALLALLLLALSSLIAASVVVPGGPWYAHYRKFLGDDLYVAYVYRSFRVAAYTTIVALVVGYAIAYVMTRVSASTRTGRSRSFAGSPSRRTSSSARSPSS